MSGGDDLKARLRRIALHANFPSTIDDLNEAADRIEKLEAENAALRETSDAWLRHQMSALNRNGLAEERE